MNLYELPGVIARIDDISADGKLLITQGTNHSTMMMLQNKSATEAVDPDLPGVLLWTFREMGKCSSSISGDMRPRIFLT